MREMVLRCAVVALLASCGADSAGAPAPSCQQAVRHYYAAGCVLSELNAGPEYTRAEAQTACEG